MAWALASLCRAEHPCIDPQRGGPVPVLRGADGSFTIHIARTGAEAPYRCAMDGRLTEPVPFVRNDGALGFGTPTFMAADTRTRAPGSADFLTIEVRSTTDAPDGCPEVSMAHGGEAASPTLVARLEAAIDALRAGCAAADLLETGDAEGAARVVSTFLSELDRQGITGLGPLVAPAHAQLAAARTAMGDLSRARQSLSLATSAAPHCHALGLRAAELDARLARTDAAASVLDQLAADPRGGAAARIAAATPSVAADGPESRSATARNAHREARRLLHQGDVEGAAAWASRALEHAGDPSHGLDLELARARGDHRTAFVLGLEQLARFGFEPELVLSMAEDARAYGDPGAGVRLLARHWHALERTVPAPLRATADRLTAAAGIDLTARIALTEDCRALSGRVLDPLARADRPRELALTRLASLRQRAATPGLGLRLLDAGYEHAPGVAPAR